MIALRSAGVPARIVTATKGAKPTASTATGPCARPMPMPGLKCGWAKNKAWVRFDPPAQ
ncbi:hypothetical protein [Comamonas sp. JC664]|uniref:hypothetical protein n=1 Tax=Comamonas sp. JC664 TaxID=2801917 RepID=UPI00361A1A53